GAGRPRAQIGRIIGRLRSSLAFRTVSELRAGDLHAFLNGVVDQCRAIHGAVHDAYIDYPIEIAFESCPACLPSAPITDPRTADRGPASRDSAMFYAIRHVTRYRYS